MIKVWLTVLYLSMQVSPLVGFGQLCPSPTAQKLQDISLYVTKKYKVAAADGNLTLIKSGIANKNCYWRFEYETTKKERLTLYLSPDWKFLSPELYDLQQDPLLEDRNRVQALKMSLLADDPPIIGSVDAPVTVVEFSDFECPYCKKLKDILESEVLPREKGKVRVAFKNFPLSMHPWAKPAAIMAACAALQNESDFWKVHDFLFENQGNLTQSNLLEKATDFILAETKLDKAQFHVCVDKELTLGIVTKEMEVGQKNGVHATPTIFVNGVKYQGVQSAAQLIEIIDNVISGKEQGVPLTASMKSVQPNECVKPSPKRN